MNQSLPPAFDIIRHGLNETADMFEQSQRDNARLVLENGQLLDELHALRTVRDRARDLVAAAVEFTADLNPVVDRLIDALAAVES